MTTLNNDKTKIYCSEGWDKLIENLMVDLREIAGNDIKVYEFKEKFGGLRAAVYYTGNDELIQTSFRELVNKAKGKSQTICEWCGEEGELRLDLSWDRTLCQDDYRKALV